MELGSQVGPQNQQICPSIQTKSRELEEYSHPHIAPQRIPMGNHRLEQCRSQVNITSPIVSEAVVLKPEDNMLE
jgi:hypothetical protein